MRKFKSEKAFAGENSVNTLKSFKSVKAIGSSRLPSGYTEVEWVGNKNDSARAYFKLDLKPKETHKYEIKSKIKYFPTALGGKFLTGGTNTVGIYISKYASVNSYFGNAKASNLYDDYVEAGGTYVFKASKDGFYVDDDLVWEPSYSSFSTTPGDLYLLGTSATTSASASADILYCKIWDGETLIRDYVPCERDQDGAYGLYDLVNGSFVELKGNAKAGSEVAGMAIKSFISVKEMSTQPEDGGND